MIEPTSGDWNETTAQGAHPAQLLGQLRRAGQAPDLAGFLRQVGPLPPRELVSVLLVDQVDQWQHGQRVPVERYLEWPSIQDDEDAVVELIYSEIVLRQEQGEAPDIAEYIRRFPRHGERLQRLLQLEDFLLNDEAANAGLPTTTGPVAVPLASPALPAVIGKYRVIASLGQGGQALVYRAVHPTLGKDVALKLSNCPGPAAADRERLVREGKVLAELEHPNLARVYDLDFHEGQPFLVMEYVRGRNLEQYAGEREPSPRESAALLARVARALALAHGRGVLHLDIKPANILIDEAGEPRLIDFGLARCRNAWSEDRVEPGNIAGTLAFMPPEQARGETDRVDARSDLFALGGVLYFLLTRQPPFQGRNTFEVLERAGRCDWDRNNVRFQRAPRRLRAICERALAADPAQRYARAEDLGADLAAFARGPRLALWAGVLGACGLFLILVVGGLSGWFSSGAPTQPTSEPAPVSTAARPSLKLLVWRERRYYPMIDVLPLETGNEVQVRAVASPGLHLSLFLFDNGPTRRLAQWGPFLTATELRYPEGERSVPLDGPAGTEVLLLCGRASGPIGLEEVRGLVEADGPWPALPGNSVMRLQRDRVRVEIGSRGFGAPLARPDPEGEVRRRLEGLRKRLVERFAQVEGLAFSHRAGSTK